MYYLKFGSQKENDKAEACLEPTGEKSVTEVQLQEKKNTSQQKKKKPPKPLGQYSPLKSKSI